ncbi:MAG TPA: class F sortase [Nakamurella sp.]
MSGRFPHRPGRPLPHHSRRRAATSLAAGAVLLAAAALLWWVGRPEPAGQTVTSVGASGALELTVSVSPTPPAGAPATTAAAALPVIASPDAGPPTVTMLPVAPPARLRIAALGVDAAVTPVGVDDGELQVPDDVDTVGWYRFGPAPGDTGSAVLVGHVDDYRQGAGVLARIGDLNPGDPIEVVDDHGVTRPFVVVAREQWPKDETPLGRLFDRGGQPRLVLITCGGAFDPNRLEYDDNITVTAAPVA